MLRLTELTLPIEHPPEALAPAIQQRLRLPDGALLGFTVFKRSYDARKKYADLSFVYTVDCELRDEAAVLAKFESDRNIHQAPDVSYHPLGRPSWRASRCQEV